jgi:tetratricopeptide (TPR) repeat protein
LRLFHSHPLARKEYAEGLKTYRKLAQKYPESYLPDVAQTLNDLGIGYIVQNRADEARKAFEEALKIYETYAKQNPEQFSSDVKRVKKLLEELHN